MIRRWQPGEHMSQTSVAGPQRRKRGPGTMGSLERDTLRDRLVMLVAAALVTGLAVPLVTSYVQSHWARQQLLLEAELARQATLIADQDQLLKRVQNELFTFRMHIVKPAWYQYKDPDPARYQAALNDFAAAGWGFHANMHQELTNVRRLASNEAYRAFHRLYVDLTKLDTELVQLARRPTARPDEWQGLHAKANGALEDIQALVLLLAQDFTLKPFAEADLPRPSATGPATAAAP